MQDISFPKDGAGVALTPREQKLREIYSGFPPETLIAAADFITDGARTIWKSGNPENPSDNRIMQASINPINPEEAAKRTVVEAILNAAGDELAKPAGVRTDTNNFTAESAVLREARDWARALKQECIRNNGTRSA